MVSFCSSCCLGQLESRFLSPWKGADPIDPQGTVEAMPFVPFIHSLIKDLFYFVLYVCVCEPEYVRHLCECARGDEKKVLDPLRPESQ